MATKTLNTKLKLRFDTYANWSNTSVANKGGNLVLLQGEAAICQVPASSTAVSGEDSRPQYLMKIGDGTHAFKDLPWLNAIAADVYPWAKGANKPSYTASEVGAYAKSETYTKTETGTQISNAIATLDSSASAASGKALSSVTITDGKITAHTDVSLGDIDTNTIYQLVTSGTTGHAFKLQKKDKGETSWTDVSTITITDNNTTYTFATGDNNGQIKVTPSGGTAQNVSVKGLTSAAFSQVIGQLPTGETSHFGDLTTAEAVQNYVDGRISGLGTIMKFQGTQATETALKALTNVKKGSVYVVTADGSEWVATADIGSTASASSWEKFGTTDVKNALYKDTNAFTNNYLLKADGTAGKVKAVAADPAAVGISFGVDLDHNQTAYVTDGTTTVQEFDPSSIWTAVNALQAKPGLDKVGTVTSVSAASNSGLKITGTASTTPTVDWDTSVILVLDGGSSTTNI